MAPTQKIVDFVSYVEAINAKIDGSSNRIEEVSKMVFKEFNIPFGTIKSLVAMVLEGLPKVK